MESQHESTGQLETRPSGLLEDIGLIQAVFGCIFGPYLAPQQH